jgi:hypothetical protein
MGIVAECSDFPLDLYLCLNKTLNTALIFIVTVFDVDVLC